MKIIKFKDFNEAYLELNRRFILEPNIGTQYGAKYICREPLILEIESYKADEIDLGKVGYKQGKWPHLLKSYVDMSKLHKFYEGLGTATSSLAYNFKDKDRGNGGCIKNIVLLRKNKKEFTEAHVYWRTCQLESKFGADLIMVARILEAAPNTKIDKVYLHMPEAFQSSVAVAYVMELAFGIELKSLKPDTQYHRHLLNNLKWMDPNHRLCLRGTTARHQLWYREILKGNLPNPVLYKHCKLPSLQIGMENI